MNIIAHQGVQYQQPVSYFHTVIINQNRFTGYCLKYNPVTGENEIDQSDGFRAARLECYLSLAKRMRWQADYYGKPQFCDVSVFGRLDRDDCGLFYVALQSAICRNAFDDIVDILETLAADANPYHTVHRYAVRNVPNDTFHRGVADTLVGDHFSVRRRGRGPRTCRREHQSLTHDQAARFTYYIQPKALRDFYPPKTAMHYYDYVGYDAHRRKARVRIGEQS